jgi:hypothetical protein
MALRKFRGKRLADVCVGSNDVQALELFGKNATDHFLVMVFYLIQIKKSRLPARTMWPWKQQAGGDHGCKTAAAN